MPGNHLILHRGANLVDVAELEKVPTPDATETWHPIPHHRFLDLVRENITGLGMKVESEEHGLWHDGLRYFGLLSLTNGHQASDYGLVIGLRNSHDQTFPAGFACGNSVFVCDNLSFSSEVVLRRKHTSRIMQDLPGLVARGLGRLGGMRATMDRRIAGYKDTPVSDTVAHDLLIRANDAGVVAMNKLGYVISEWRKPTHEEFSARTAWSLFNAFTEVLKRYNQLELPKRTMALYGLMDQVANVKVEEIQVDSVGALPPLGEDAEEDIREE